MKQTKQFKYGYHKLSLEVNPQFFSIPNNKKSIIQAKIKQLTLHCELGDTSIFTNKNNEIEQLEIAQPVYNIQGEETLVTATNCLFIEFKSSVSRKEQRLFLKKEDLKVNEIVSKNAYLVTFSQHLDSIDLAIALQKNELIACVEPDLVADTAQYSFQLPTDELLHKQWYLQNNGVDPYGKNQHWKYRQGADAKVIEAWRILQENKGTICSSDLTIAVLDKGFDLSHPDFLDKIIAARDFNHENNSGIPNAFAVTKDGNGSTEADHGTACAGIAVASANGSGIVGAAPNVKFMPIRYYVANGRFMRAMFRHMIKNGADIASCSFGNVGLPMDRLTIQTLHHAATKGRNGRGMVIVFATGNAYSILKKNEIATHPDVIAVGATTSEDGFAPYTNRTRNMSVVAPGGYGHSGTMTTADVGFLDALSSSGELVEAGKGRENNPYYRNNAEGTSFATPLVAGVCALVLTANSDLTAKEVKSIIETTADKVGDIGEYDENGHSFKFGHGRINAANAVRKALGLPTKDYKTAFGFGDDVPSFSFDYGQTIAGSHTIDSEEAVLKYVINSQDAGKNLLVEVEVALDHNPNHQFELFVQKGRKPVYFPEDFIDKNLGENPKLLLTNIEAGEYVFMLRCFNKQWEYINGGGDFEITFTVNDEPVA